MLISARRWPALTSRRASPIALGTSRVRTRPDSRARASRRGRSEAPRQALRAAEEGVSTGRSEKAPFRGTELACDRAEARRAASQDPAGAFGCAKRRFEAVKVASARRRAGLTQIDLAKRIGETQSFVSKCERGERKIDVIELRAFCAAFGISLKKFDRILERRLPRGAEG